MTLQESAGVETSADLTHRVRQIHRPHRRLWLYYVLTSLLWGPLLPVVLAVHYFRYRTLRYDFGDDGIAMSWGVLFRREIHLTYARIQDIHLRSNVLERWLGLARVLIQTASGSSSAEMTIVGVLEYEALRDFIYQRMRGAAPSERGDATDATNAGGAAGELVRVLDDVATELREIRTLLQRDTAR